MNLDGRIVVTGDDLGLLKAIDVGSGKVVFQTSISSADDRRRVAVTHLSRTGARDNIVVCTSDGAIHQLLNFRDVATVPGRLEGGTVGIGELDEHRALLCSPAGELHFLQDKILIPSSMTVGNNIQCMQTSQKERILAVAGKEQELELWDLQHEKSTFRAKNVASDELGLRVPVDNRCIAFTSKEDTKIVAVGTGLGRLRLYDTRCGQRRPVQDLDTSLNRRNGIPSACTAIDVWNRSEPGSVVVATGDGDLRAFDLRSKQVQGVFRGHSGSIKTIRSHQSEPLLASGGFSRFLLIHDVKSRAQLAKVYVINRVMGVVWAPENSGKQLASKLPADVNLSRGSSLTHSQPKKRRSESSR
ncbi:hypothetical protein NDN08_002768 [Rhodosorus marinus]|uniref:Ribosome biogenesis protein NSA1 n=1 Tax=Rhodosorus marinus TaxID=101924 RepID=A0AAV8UUM8_9RHOD|nr:hypothetical protein NDN08_002768 [Rhodosorus marinus]